MSAFEYIKIEGYRRLLDVELEMRPLTVMIGVNGVGKTSFLEIFSLLAASAKGQLADKLSELGGLNEVITRDLSNRLKFRLKAIEPEQVEPLDYYFRLIPTGLSYEITEETLNRYRSVTHKGTYIQSKQANIKYYIKGFQEALQPNWEYNPLETALSQAPKMLLSAEFLRSQLASCTFYGPLNVSSRSPVRLPQPMQPAKLPGANGEDLASCLYYLRETAPDRFEIIEDTLSAAFSDFERLGFPPVAAGTLAMTWKDKNFSRPLYMHQLSEGTLRFLWLVTLLQSQDLTTVTLIDEPEVSLHPELLQLLVDVMREASQRTQLIVATHSDRLIRFLKPNEVLVCDVQDGLTEMTWADSLDLEKWLEDYSLDQVWAMNLMGGRP